MAPPVNLFCDGSEADSRAGTIIEPPAEANGLSGPPAVTVNPARLPLVYSHW
jgi:hypothetical protein